MTFHRIEGARPGVVRRRIGVSVIATITLAVAAAPAPADTFECPRREPAGTLHDTVDEPRPPVVVNRDEVELLDDSDLPSPDEMLEYAQEGNAYFQYQIGLMYLNGESMPLSYQEAARWLTCASRQDVNEEFRRWIVANAQGVLGVMYSQGLGVIKDEVLAYVLLSVAVVNGNDAVRDERDALEPWLVHFGRLDEARELARQWLHDHELIGRE